MTPCIHSCLLESRDFESALCLFQKSLQQFFIPRNWQPGPTKARVTVGTVNTGGQQLNRVNCANRAPVATVPLCQCALFIASVAKLHALDTSSTINCCLALASWQVPFHLGCWLR